MARFIGCSSREEYRMLFIGDDWAEAHHDIEIEDEAGRRLAGSGCRRGWPGSPLLHELIAEHLDPTGDADQVLGRDRDRPRPWVQALIAAGYLVYAINPLQVAALSGAARRPRGRSPIRAMRMCWPRSSGSTGPITAGRRGLRDRRARQGRRPGASDDDLVPACGRSTRCGRCCGSSTRPRWPRSVPTWPAGTRWRCWPPRRHPSRAAG